MSQYIFTYRRAKGYAAGDEATAEWGGWFDRIGASIVDPGKPVFERTTLGEVGDSTELGGYTVVTADDLSGAVALAQGCPALRHGGGVEVGVLTDLPTDSEVMRAAKQAVKA